MARSFVSIPTLPYAGNFVRMPVKYVPKAYMVAVYIDWINYMVALGTTSCGVDVNLDGNSPGAKLSGIAAVYIDNTASELPIYVYFPDTRFVAVAQPNCAIWVPVTTALTQCTVFGINLPGTTYPKTNIFLVDSVVPGFVDIEKQYVYDQWKSSPVINRGDNPQTPGYAGPALGDQIQQASLALQGTGGSVVTTNLFGGLAATAGNFVYVTSIDMLVTSIGFGTNVVTADYLRIASTGASGTLVNCAYVTAGGTFLNQHLYTMSGLQLRLSGNEVWQLQGTRELHQFNTAQGQLIISYTINPN